MSRRVFYFSGYRLKVFEWQGKQLLGSAVFEPTEEGFAEFETYLAQATATPVQLLVDLIEEDFRRESIPHVAARDRKVLLARLLDRLHRGEPYVHVMNLGRSNEGRRDDLILLSALPNSDILAPWLTRMAQLETPLAGIWSLPLLSTKLLAACTAGEANILLLSQQIRTAHRETYFSKGQLLFSRQAKLERGHRDTFDVQSRAQAISKSAEQIRIFLTNQRTMGFADKLYVYCLVPEDILASLAEHTHDSSGITYKYVPLVTIYTQLKLPASIVPKEDVLFSYLCATAPLSPDHYATPVQKKFFRRLSLDYWLGRASVLTSVLLLVAAGVLWLHSLDIDQQHQQLKLQRQLLDQRYASEYAPRQAALDQAAALQSKVEFVRRLDQEAQQSLDQLMEPLSRVFSDARFGALQLDSLVWKKYPPAQVQLLLQQAQASVSAASLNDAEPEAQEEPAQTLQASIILGGHLQRGAMSYRATVALMTEFADALRQLPEIAGAVTLKMPVDVRPPLTFVDDSGAELAAANLQQEQEDNRYEILLAVSLPTPLPALDAPLADGQEPSASLEDPSAPVEEPSAYLGQSSAQSEKPSVPIVESSSQGGKPSNRSNTSVAKAFVIKGLAHD